MNPSLKYYHQLTGNFNWFREILEHHSKRSDRTLDISAGYGTLGSYLLKYFSPPAHTQNTTPIPFPPTSCETGGVLTWEGTPFFDNPPTPTLDYTGLSKIKQPAYWPETWCWRHTHLDAIENFKYYNIIIINWFCYTITPETLKMLGEKCQTGPRLIIINEPNPAFKGKPIINFMDKMTHHSRLTHELKKAYTKGLHAKALINILQLNSNDWITHSYNTIGGSYRIVAQKNHLYPIHNP